MNAHANGGTKPLRILIVEDNEDDTVLLVHELARGGHPIEHVRVDSAAGLNAALDAGGWDFVFSDHNLPGFSSTEALEIITRRGLDIPFVIVSGVIGEERAVAAMKAGAHDFIMKGQTARLLSVVERELREAQVRRERRAAEERLKASLREKEVLITEIHHRVKNNLQIICSLVNLEARFVKNRRDLDRFMDLRNRVRSMALVHEKLYESQDFSRVSFAGYIRSLGDELIRSHGALARGIALRYECEEVSLDLDMAIPCGLIVTELISNALKHAFAPDSAGASRRPSREIRVSLRAQDGILLLAVADNGRGLPPGMDPEREHSLGLNLVRTLTDQLHGTMRIVPRDGLAFEFQFPLAAPARTGELPGGAAS